jgi:phenylacetate-CoA ligase
LANRTFPFIRYDLGDQVDWLDAPCECGSAFARLADIGGRRDDDFRYGPITMPAIAFRHVLGTDPSVSEYQVTQTVDGADILTVGSPDVDTLTRAVADALRRYGLADPAVEIRVVDRIPRHHASGNLKRFIAMS